MKDDLIGRDIESKDMGVSTRGPIKDILLKDGMFSIVTEWEALRRISESHGWTWCSKEPTTFFQVVTKEFDASGLQEDSGYVSFRHLLFGTWRILPRGDNLHPDNVR